MPDYLAFGHVIHSEVALPELIHACPEAVDPASPVIEVREGAGPNRPAATWVRHFRSPTRSRWLSIGRSGDDHVLRFPRIADFLVSADGTRVVVKRRADASASTVRHLLLDHVLPRCLARAGETVLHASAVVIDGRAVAFMGPTGAGKSTVAVALSQVGAALLTDDCLVVREGEPPLAIASYPGVRLWPESIEALDVPGVQTEVTQASEKRRLTAESGAGSAPAAGAPLREICLLATDEVDAAAEACGNERPYVERLSGGAAFLAVLTHSFRLETGEKADLIADADRAGRLASATTVLELYLPTELDALRATAGPLLEQFMAASSLPAGGL